MYVNCSIILTHHSAQALFFAAFFKLNSTLFLLIFHAYSASCTRLTFRAIIEDREEVNDHGESVEDWQQL